MNEIDLAALIVKYNQGIATPAEKRFVEMYYDALEQRPSYTDSLDATTEAEIRDTIRAQIEPPLSLSRSTKSRFSISWLGYAAAAIALLIGSYWFLFQNITPAPTQPLLSNQTQLPTIADQNRYLQLKDGSLVILVGESTLEYVTSFDKASTREVRLIGEAFFDIQHDANKPFLVHTGQLTTQVVGTSFAIKNDENTANILVRVFTGKVQVNHHQRVLSILTKNEQLIYDLTLENLQQSVFETNDKLDWYKEDLYCDDITVAQACAIIESRYDVIISVQGTQLRQKRFTTTFLKEESLDTILHSVALFNEASLEKLEDSTHLKPHYILSPL